MNLTRCMERPVRTHPFAPDARERPGKTPVRTALSPRYLIRPPWPGAATRDENRWARPSSAFLVRQSPLIRGRFSFQYEAAGSSPARPTKPPLTSGNASHSASRYLPNRMHPGWDEVLRAIPERNQKNASEQPLYGPTVVEMPQMVGCTAVSEPIPVLGPTHLLRHHGRRRACRSAGPDPGEEDVGRAVLEPASTNREARGPRTASPTGSQRTPAGYSQPLRRNPRYSTRQMRAITTSTSG